VYSFLEQISIESVFNELPIGIVFLKKDGKILVSNSSFKRIVFEKNTSEIGQSIWSHIITNQDDDQNQIIQKGHEYKLITFNDQILYLKTKEIKPKHNSEKIYIGLLSGKENILRLGAELEKKIAIIGDIEEELEFETELSEMKSRFLSIASHEFRTPLAGILSSINLINRYKMAELSVWNKISNHKKIEKHLEKVKESVRYLTSIINKFLALRNITKGEIPLKTGEFDIQALISKQKEQLKEICKRGQAIHYKHYGNLSMVKLDQHLMENIINNLLSNAIKYSSENTNIQISSSLKENELTIWVKDEGIGIPLKEQDKIFTRFYRAKNALRFAEGTGLGLNLVKNYVEIMQGIINFESHENKGTSFLIKMPNKLK